jgi:hypothetical protein
MKIVITAQFIIPIKDDELGKYQSDDEDIQEMLAVILFENRGDIEFTVKEASGSDLRHE